MAWLLGYIVTGLARQGAGRQLGQAAGIAHAFGGFVHRTQQEILAAGSDAETGAFGFDEGAGEFGERPEGGVAGHPSQAPGEGGRPAAEVLAQELLLRVAAQGQVLGVELMFESVGFFGGQHAHEFQFQADVVVALAGVGGDFQAEGAVERGEVGQAMRLKERVGLDVAVFDFVQGTATARGMTKRGEIRRVEGLESLRLEL